MKICQLTSVHPRYDTRIFVKECISLANAGYDTYLVVADGLGDETKEGVKIVDTGIKEKSRKKRPFVTGKKILKKALEIDADIYHFHDPELLLIANKIRRKGKKIIYDVHEDVPKQILTKGYLNPHFSGLISFVFEKYEKRISSKLSAVVCAEPVTRNRFEKINKNTIDVKNFPIIKEFSNQAWEERENNICYIGAISEVRGIKVIVKALEKLDTKLLLAGNFQQNIEEIKALEGWEKVEFYGFVGRKEIAEILAKSKIGLVLLHPIPKYLDAFPVKMFEYMAAGVPILASDFDLYKQIVESNNCGIIVDPLDVDKIAETITQMLADDQMLKQMSINGQKAVREKYNWANEEKKLLQLYETLSK